MKYIKIWAIWFILLLLITFTMQFIFKPSLYGETENIFTYLLPILDLLFAIVIAYLTRIIDLLKDK